MSWTLIFSPCRSRGASTVTVPQGSGAHSTGQAQAVMPRNLSLNSLWGLPKFRYHLRHEMDSGRIFAIAGNQAGMSPLSDTTVTTHLHTPMVRSVELLSHQRPPFLLFGPKYCSLCRFTKNYDSAGLRRHQLSFPAAKVGSRRQLSAIRSLEPSFDDVIEGGHEDSDSESGRGTRSRRRGGPVYAVAVGFKTGVFDNWDEAEQAVRGYSGAVYRKFSTEGAARMFVESRAAAAAAAAATGISNGEQRSSTVAAAAAVSGAGGSGFPVALRPPQPLPEPLGPFYAVARGHQSGVFLSWSEAAAAAKGAPGVVYKRFNTRAEAERFLEQHRHLPPPPPSPRRGRGKASKAPAAGAGEEPVKRPRGRPRKVSPAKTTIPATADIAHASSSSSLSFNDVVLHGDGVGAVGAVDTTTEAGGSVRTAQAPLQRDVSGASGGGFGDRHSQAYYAVAMGKQVGVFSSWADARAAIEGVSGAQFRKFKKLAEAYAYLAAASQHRQNVVVSESVVDGGGGGANGAEDLHGGTRLGGGDAAQDKRSETEREGARSQDEHPVDVLERQSDVTLSAAAALTTTAVVAAAAAAAAAPLEETDVELSPVTTLAAAAPAAILKSDVEEEAAKLEVAVHEPQLLRFEALTGEVDPLRTYRLEFDGGARRNPGDAGFGAVLVDAISGRHVEYLAGPLTASSNNVAEWSALAAGMQAAVDMGVRHLIVQGDSELVCRQVSGRYGINTPALQPLAARVLRLRARLESFKVKHVPRDENAVADLLSNLAMDAEEVVAEVASEGDQQLSVLGGRRQRRQRQRQQMQLRELLRPMLRELGQPAIQAAREAFNAASAASPFLSDVVLETTTLSATPGSAKKSVAAASAGVSGRGKGVPEREMVGAGGRAWLGRTEVVVTECAPPLTARGSVAGSLEEFHRVLLALACMRHGLLD